MPELSGGWSVVVHGGAKTIAPAMFERNRDGCEAAAAAAAAVLRFGGTAVAAAEAAVRSMENDPVFNAGFGSVPNRDGMVEMDAAMMDGATLDIGAVAAVRRLRNPVAAAVRMLREPPVLLVADGAEHFAEESGLALADPAEMIAPQVLAAEATQGHDTVGCVARDQHGNIAVATSTGGLAGTRAGRTGDAPLPGCGFYADDRAGGVALSGDGEAIARAIVAARIMRALEDGAAANTAAEEVAVVARLGGEAGAIVLDRAGRVGVAHNSDHFAIGMASDTCAPCAFLHQNEMRDALND